MKTANPPASAAARAASIHGSAPVETPLDAVGVRILGALIEKEITTPEAYPLTLNALTAACNQRSNRDPVLELDDAAVVAGLADLERRSLVRAVHRSDGRARRYRQTLSESLSLHPAETAVLCVLMLRGAQTAGEIRARTARLHEFADLARVEITLQALMTLPTPLVVELPRRPGRKEARYAHLLAGPVAQDATMAGPPQAPDRVEALEAEVASLRAALEALRAEFETFRDAFR